MDNERLAAHLNERPDRLMELKKQGIKIIGYFPGNYVPEEIIYAAGAIPICLIDHGGTDSAEAALKLIPHISCPFSRAQIGEKILKTNPYYEMIDLLVAPITCQHLKKIAEIWDYLNEVDIFKLGVPHKFYGEDELEYYTNRIRTLQGKIETLTGNRISNENLSKAITLYNRMRDLLKKISLLRRASPQYISSIDFIRLNHASYYADPVFMVDYLDYIYDKLSRKSLGSENNETKPRLMLIGPNIAKGDYKVLELISDAGGNVVIEEICEGVRDYWQTIEELTEPIASLAKGYLRDKLPCAFMRYSSQKRINFVLKMINDFSISGIIWYQLLYCESYDTESYFYKGKLREHNIPMLIIESNYDKGSYARMKTRIDAFIEMVKGGIE